MDPAAHINQARSMATALLVDTIRVHRPRRSAETGRYSSPAVEYVPDEDTVPATVQYEDAYAGKAMPGAADLATSTYVVKTLPDAQLVDGCRVEVVTATIDPTLTGRVLTVTQASRQTFGVLLRAKAVLVESVGLRP